MRAGHRAPSQVLKHGRDFMVCPLVVFLRPEPDVFVQVDASIAGSLFFSVGHSTSYGKSSLDSYPTVNYIYIYILCARALFSLSLRAAEYLSIHASISISFSYRVRISVAASHRYDLLFHFSIAIA